MKAVNILFSFVILAQIYGCNQAQVDNELQKTKDVFKREYSIDIHTHFPNNVINDHIVNANFNRPDSFSYYGSSFITLKMQEADINEITKRKFVYKSNLNNDLLFIISSSLVKDCEKIDTAKSYENAFPIANIYSVDFNLGETPDSVYIPEGNKFYPIEKYVVPDDMEIYIISFSSGNYWINKHYNQQRCSFIGKYRNGYSYGYAISKKYSYVTYWAVAW
ncbi:hypothetical protein SDC9_65781 [bioreactor metagenome]|uniref:Uncharacterized protein n=1 Tax=bioreactor metagenome TaxID=1076179 RepID=A0A644XUA2_9ZZZZ